MRTPLQKDTHSVRDTMQSTIAQRASSAFARISTRASMRRQVRVSSSSFNRVLLLPAHGLVVGGGVLSFFVIVIIFRGE